ncbi:type II secretion system protein [Bacillus solitudinis]|uniref:type II secretion system protein n=1 Tax=Bacillus solitudinis TaxID=2014074 RepID=UPI000C248FA6|nr:type II secretion system protein [Bacillus solitudinis]
MNYQKQQGVTLVELLVIIVIMVAITAPIIAIVSHSLQTEREVSNRNHGQREARFIMEYATGKMRDSGNYWFVDGDNWVLCSYEEGTGCTETFLTYSPMKQEMRMGGTGDRILSEEVRFQLNPGPLTLSSPNLSALDRKQEVTIEITKAKQVIELKSNVYFDRF